jgi:2-hydroxychromene-2-carboxylate isomerase
VALVFGINYPKQALIDSSILELYEELVTKARLLIVARPALTDNACPEERPVVSPLKIEFQFDFGSPNAYLAELALPDIERRTGVKFEYVPVLLGGIYKATNNMSPAESLRGIRNKPEYLALETQRFIRRHNITRFRQNPFFPVNTLMLMRGAVAAQFEGAFEPYFRAAYHHMWEEPKKMDDLEVFRSAFASSGIDIERLIARAQQDDVKKRLIELTTDAVDRGAFGSPTFFVGKEMFFGKDQLRDVEESIVEQTSHAVPKSA